MPTTIHLLRHGEVYNPDEILYGRMPNFGLSDNGRNQAEAARDVLADKKLAAFFASPQQRAQETAAIISAPHTGLTVQMDNRLNEVKTSYQGQPLAELEKIGFDLYTDAPPEDEQPEDILSRTLDFINVVRGKYKGQEIAAITHGDVLVFMFLHVKGVELKVQAKGNLQSVHGLPDPYPQTCSINSFTYKTDNPDEIPAFRYLRPY